MFCENSVEAYLFKFGVAKAGLTVVPVNPMLAPDVVAYLIETGRAVVRDRRRRAVAEASDGVRARRASPPTRRSRSAASPSRASRLLRELVDGAPATEPDVEIHGDDVWEIIFTSGTTAMPKGAMVSHNYSYLGALLVRAHADARRCGSSATCGCARSCR